MTSQSARGLLVLARHGQSEGNAHNVFTGWRDLPLTGRGRQEARAVAQALEAEKIALDAVFCSRLRRTVETAEIVVATLGKPIPVFSEEALNERDYGDLTGMDKDEAALRFGAGQVREWRRSYDTRPPGGESLADTRARVVACYRDAILPRLERGENVLVVAHGNSLRALVMELEGLTPAQIERYELKTGEIVAYRFDGDNSAERLAPIAAAV